MLDPRQAIVPASMALVAETYRFSPAVRAGDLLFVAGQIGIDEAMTVIADPEEQYATAFANMRVVLEAAGAGLGDVVELTSYHTSFDGFDLFQRVKDRCLDRPPYPAWTAVAVAALGLPGLLVEMKCVARAPGSG